MNWVALPFTTRWGHLVYTLTGKLASCDTRHEAARTGYTSSVKGDDTTARRLWSVTMRVMDLQPGDKVRIADQEGIFIASVSPHPLYPQLWMVIWRMIGGRIQDRWSHDALSPLQDVGEVVQPRTKECFEARLRFALHKDMAAARIMMNLEDAALSKGV